MLEFETEVSFDGWETAYPATVEITDYSPGCDGDRPGMGPPMSYASINAPEPEEMEFRVMRDGEDITDKLDDDDFKELESQCLDELAREKRSREQDAAEHAYESRMEARYGY